ncbi:hypothetical protein PR048_009365 [Dryococelus australis]|uniref:Uncharacterized protein n=1 Tax=Dryococelus australis TaxID=614101 RepID=A0ABQ9HZR8_9NEOP|nr:hypothetical protein PR048_009365 [Dryococelus australis]
MMTLVLAGEGGWACWLGCRLQVTGVPADWMARGQLVLEIHWCPPGRTGPLPRGQCTPSGVVRQQVKRPIHHLQLIEIQHIDVNRINQHVFPIPGRCYELNLSCNYGSGGGSLATTHQNNLVATDGQLPSLDDLSMSDNSKAAHQFPTGYSSMPSRRRGVNPFFNPCDKQLPANTVLGGISTSFAWKMRQVVLWQFICTNMSHTHSYQLKESGGVTNRAVCSQRRVEEGCGGRITPPRRYMLAPVANAHFCSVVADVLDTSFPFRRKRIQGEEGRCKAKRDRKKGDSQDARSQRMLLKHTIMTEGPGYLSKLACTEMGASDTPPTITGLTRGLMCKMEGKWEEARRKENEPGRYIWRNVDLIEQFVGDVLNCHFAIWPGLAVIHYHPPSHATKLHNCHGMEVRRSSVSPMHTPDPQDINHGGLTGICFRCWVFWHDEDCSASNPGKCHSSFPFSIARRLEGIMVMEFVGELQDDADNEVFCCVLENIWLRISMYFSIKERTFCILLIVLSFVHLQ